MIQILKARLGEMPVLTMFASQIATRTRDAEPEMTRNEMIDGRLFNGADIDNRRIAINQSV